MATKKRKRLGNIKKRVIYRYTCIGECGAKRYTFSYDQFQKALCKKCQSLIPPEGQDSLFDTIETPAFVVVPSGRIDYCGDCKTEHGYECPKYKEIPA